MMSEAERIAELQAEVDRLRAIIESTRRPPMGSEREALWRRAERNKASKPWRTVWHLLRCLEVAEGEAARRPAVCQHMSGVTMTSNPTVGHVYCGEC